MPSHTAYLPHQDGQHRLHLCLEVEQLVGHLYLGRRVNARLFGYVIRRLRSLLEDVGLRVRFPLWSSSALASLDEIPAMP